MTNNRQDGTDAGEAQTQAIESVINRELCLTESFWDREVELTRCLENRSCRYKRGYLHMTICDCPRS